MKILYLADIRFPMERANGIQTVETSHALARRGVEVELVVRRSDRRSDEDCLAFFGLAPHPCLRLRRVGAPGRAGFFGAVVPTLLGTTREDVVFTRDLLLAEVAVSMADAPLLYEAHTVAAVFAEERARLYRSGNPPSARKLARLDAREARVCRGASGVITITSALLEALEARHGPIRRARVVRDGSRVPETPPEPPPSEGPKAIYYIGQLYPWKGVDVLVRAMTRVRNATLVVVGGLPPEPDLDRVRALADELDLGDRVRFTGFLPPPELEAERRKASVFVLPNLESTTSRLYTSPLKLFEAMASGRPVVASDLPAIREVLTHENNALLVPPGNPEALAAALERLLAEPALASRLAVRAFDDVRAYSWDRRAAEIEALARELCRPSEMEPTGISRAAPGGSGSSGP